MNSNLSRRHYPEQRRQRLLQNKPPLNSRQLGNYLIQRAHHNHVIPLLVASRLPAPAAAACPCRRHPKQDLDGFDVVERWYLQAPAALLRV